MRNIRTICEFKSWNRDIPAWKQIVVCLMFPGINECDPGVLNVLQTMGIFQDNIMEKDVDGTLNKTMHLFEYTTQISITENLWLDIEGANEPVQFLLAIKNGENNIISSHRSPLLFHS